MITKSVLAEEAAGKEKQRQLRLDIGLPDLEDSRGIWERVFGKKLRTNTGAALERNSKDEFSLKEVLVEIA